MIVVSKYKTIIKGQDVNPPCFGSVQMGSRVFIECIQRLWIELNEEGKGTIIKPFVAGSVVAIDEAANSYELAQEDDVTFCLKDKSSSGQVFLGYLPSLDMVITNLRVQNEEWEKGYTWELHAEEI